MRVELYQIHWVLTAAGIARTVVIAATGWLSGLCGPRTLYLLCIGSLGIGSLGSVLAWDWPSLIVFRMLAGAGGGMIPQLSQAIFYQIFPPGKRGMALGIALMGWSVGPAFGPLMGGNIVEVTSWRAVYAVTLLLSGTGCILAWWLLPALRHPKRRRLDVYGSVTMTIAVATLLWALSLGNREGWDSQIVLTLLTVSGVATVIFVIVELCHPEPLVELRLFRSLSFTMGLVVLFLTTMAFRSTGPMFPVLMQRLLGFEPLQVAWVQMLPNLLYGAAVLMVGRVSDRLPTYTLVVSGLIVYAAIFFIYAGVNETTTFAMMITFLSFRFLAEALIVSPNNLAILSSLPESQIYMATGLTGLLRSIANAMSAAVAAVVWDQRYNVHILHYAEETPVDAFGFTAALDGLGQRLQWAGEIVAMIPTQTMALLQERLFAEASTAAWQDYFVFNGLLALISIVPALPLWRRKRVAVPVPSTVKAAPSRHVPASNASGDS